MTVYFRILMMVKLYYYTTKSVYEGILTEEVIMQPDTSQSLKDRKCDRGIYLTTLGPQNFEGLTLIPLKWTYLLKIPTS